LGVARAQGGVDADVHEFRSNYWFPAGTTQPPGSTNIDRSVYEISAYYDWSMTTAPNQSYGPFDGTSAACPQVAAAAAMTFSRVPNATWGQVNRHIQKCTKQGAQGDDFNWLRNSLFDMPGVVDLYKIATKPIDP
jgi:subtilisin family serine protease